MFWNIQESSEKPDTLILLANVFEELSTECQLRVSEFFFENYASWTAFEIAKFLESSENLRENE
jgi:hypothetical protein